MAPGSKLVLFRTATAVELVDYLVSQIPMWDRMEPVWQGRYRLCLKAAVRPAVWLRDHGKTGLSPAGVVSLLDLDEMRRISVSSELPLEVRADISRHLDLLPGPESHRRTEHALIRMVLARAILGWKEGYSHRFPAASGKVSG